MIDDKNLDLALIRACRRLCSLYLCTNQDVEVNGISLNDAILPLYPDVRYLYTG